MCDIEMLLVVGSVAIKQHNAVSKQKKGRANTAVGGILFVVVACCIA